MHNLNGLVNKSSSEFVHRCEGWPKPYDQTTGRETDCRL